MRRALLALLVVVPLAASCGGGGDDIAALPPGSFASASGELGPPIHLFGDTINADVSVVVDKTKLDPGRVSLKMFFEPYEPIEEMGVARREAGNLAEIGTGFAFAVSSAPASPRPWGRSRTRADRPRARSGSSPRRCSTPIPVRSNHGSCAVRFAPIESVTASTRRT